MTSLISLLLASSLSFGSPVNGPLSLAGNFGEPRPNHFHCGIDVRTGQVEGKPIFSVADGYVSRITVGLHGFGNALYVRHPNGITSVYCHLKKFTPRLAAFVRAWQYRNKKSYADVTLRPTDCPVARGQLIAVSGNTGASKAPHLHLEFHVTNTGTYVDPLDYLKDFVDDSTKPIAHSFMAYPVKGYGLFCGSSSKQTYGFSSLNLARRFTAWGKVGFGVWGNDYMDGSFGILGVRHVTLEVDGNVVFESNVDNIPANHNLMVNSWGDYEHYCRTHLWYMKSFSDPGNKLPVLTYNANRGYVLFNEERDYQLVYTLSDIFGNSRSYSFTVRGQRQDIPPKSNPYVTRHLCYDRFNVFQRPGVSLLLNPGLLPDDADLYPVRRINTDGYSDKWSFYNKSYPLLGWARVSLKLKKKVRDTDKLYIICNYGSNRYMGGIYDNGWVTGKMRDLGAVYEIGYDDTPPVMSNIIIDRNVIRLGLSDSGSGIKSFEGYVDGQFVLFEKVDKTNIYMCKLKDTPVQASGGKRRLRLVAEDNLKNRTVVAREFVY